MTDMTEQDVKEAKGHPLYRLAATLLVAVLSFLAGQSFNADKLRQEARNSREDDIQAIANKVNISLEPIMNMCRDAAFRSIRASDRVGIAVDRVNDVQSTISDDFTRRKELIDDAVKPEGAKK